MQLGKPRLVSNFKIIIDQNFIQHRCYIQPTPQRVSYHRSFPFSHHRHRHHLLRRHHHHHHLLHHHPHHHQALSPAPSSPCRYISTCPSSVRSLCHSRSLSHIRHCRVGKNLSTHWTCPCSLVFGRHSRMVDFGVGNTLVVVGIGVGRICGGHDRDWARRRGGLNVLRSIDSCCVFVYGQFR
jgi:hypothetical protein